MNSDEALAREWAEDNHFDPGTDYGYEHIIEAWIAGWKAAFCDEGDPVDWEYVKVKLGL